MYFCNIIIFWVRNKLILNDNKLVSMQTLYRIKISLNDMKYLLKNTSLWVYIAWNAGTRKYYLILWWLKIIYACGIIRIAKQQNV